MPSPMIGSLASAVMPEVPLRIAIGIATYGRPDILAEVLRELERQTHHPDRIVVCGTSAADLACGPVTERVEFVLAAAGSSQQRNAIIDRLDNCEIVLFLDDDFLPASHYISATLAAFANFPDLVATTGITIADGSRGPGVGVAEARALILADEEDPSSHGATYTRVPHGYGCNMAARLHVVRQHAVRFDENLPLYAWSEDVDFTHRLARHGWIAKLDAARGVHLGTKQGRTPGYRLGYSQVANPIYLFGKGSYSFGRAARSVGRNLAANLIRSPRPEPYIDRRGRLRGNILALADLLRGRLSPARILEL